MNENQYKYKDTIIKSEEDVSTIAVISYCKKQTKSLQIVELYVTVFLPIAQIDIWLCTIDERSAIVRRL